MSALLDDWEKKAEVHIHELKSYLDNGELAQDEYDELVKDVADTSTIIKLLDNEKDRILAATIAEGLMVLAGAL
tara:strand:+ start:1009 stop:1230 length:222 start_codon:yes stop_codon:yes gene_type:complete